MLPKVQHPRRHAFLCFQIIEAPKIIREFTPLLCSFSTLFIVLRHQLAKLPSFGLGIEPARPIGANNLNQNSLATTHVVRRCCIDSSSWSQRGHLSGWESPLLASLSAVQHLLRIANPRKNLHFVRWEINSIVCIIIDTYMKKNENG